MTWQRNSTMLGVYHMVKGTTIVVGFPGGSGTTDCLRKAKEMGYLVMQVAGKA